MSTTGTGPSRPPLSDRAVPPVDATPPPRLTELGAFLKARRAELSPAQARLPEPATVRRVPGLRREEVAQLAAISTDYYTRVEQGRRLASTQVLTTLAEVLRLDDDQRVYVFELARKYRCENDRTRRAHLHPRWQRLLDEFAHSPAVVLGPFTDILAWNELSAALITDFGRLRLEHRNYVHLMLTDPAMRQLFPDWSTLATNAVAYLRMDSAADPDSERLTQLVTELTTRSPEFRRMWNTYTVAALDEGTKTFRHPVIGELTLDWDVLTSAAYPGQRLVVLSAEPDSAAATALRVLASSLPSVLPH